MKASLDVLYFQNTFNLTGEGKSTFFIFQVLLSRLHHEVTDCSGSFPGISCSTLCFLEEEMSSGQRRHSSFQP